MTSGPDFATRRPRRAPAALDQAVMTLGIIAVAFVSYLCWATYQDLVRTRDGAAQARRSLDADRARLRPPGSGKDGPEEALAARALLTEQAPPRRVLADLADILPAEVRLEDLTLSYGSLLELEMRVAARRASSYDRFLKRLGESPRFQDILPGAENRDGEVSASVRATYGDGGSR